MATLLQIGKAEYILLELMRLGKTDVASIAIMTQVLPLQKRIKAELDELWMV
jgi:hypothetical protein